MCGIAGIISNTPRTGETYQKTLDAIHHRGPDSGAMIQCGQASLLFRRLAIIDLSPSGNQPMCNETQSVWIVFNGEIYNFAELRRELLEKHQFQSNTDTETLIHGYEEWGFEGLLRRIDGMYAFAIWDEEKQTLFFAKDRVGKKPFFYTELPSGEFAFASTLNALLTLLPEKPEVDRVALDQYLIYQAVPAPHTIYKGIFSLLPAQFGTIKLGEKVQLGTYWTLSYAHKKKRKEPELLDELDARLRQAVARRLMSDVPLGAFLSGGVDSGLVVGLMSQLRDEPVETVTIGFEDPKFDERPFARMVADRWKANSHEYTLPANEIYNLPEIIWHYGQPVADVSIVPTFAVSRCAREHVTVILNGDGGDEGFGGYSRPMIAHAAQTCYEKIPVLLHQPTAKGLSLLGKRGKLLSSALRASRPQDRFVYERGFRKFRDKLYQPEAFRSLKDIDADAHYHTAWEKSDGPTDGDRVLNAELTTYLPNQLLTKMDVSTMAHSVEGRSPLLDIQLLEFAATIPIEQLMQGWQTKYLLKRLAERYIPSEIIYRRKQGFVMPINDWIQGELAPTISILLKSVSSPERGMFDQHWVMSILEEHKQGITDWSQQIWTLVVFEVWYRIFIEESIDRHTNLKDLL